MKSTDIEADVSSLQQQRDTLRDQLNLLLQRFQSELPSAAESWIKREVERRIEDHPDIVAALGIDKLRSLKTKVNALIASLPDIAMKETSNRADWPHYRKPSGSSYGGGVSESFFDKAFRNVISHLGAVLDEFGLLAEPKGHVASWEKAGDGNVRYAINPGFDARSTPVLGEFGQVYKEFRSVEEKLENRQKDLAKAKARELWESA
jgi:hypothetical protein